MTKADDINEHFRTTMEQHQVVRRILCAFRDHFEKHGYRTGISSAGYNFGNGWITLPPLPVAGRVPNAIYEIIDEKLVLSALLSGGVEKTVSVDLGNPNAFELSLQAVNYLSAENHRLAGLPVLQ